MKYLKRILWAATAFAGFSGPIDHLHFKGRFHIEVTHADGSVDRHDITNAVTTAGKNAIFDSFFRNQAQPATWYIGLIDNAGFTAVAVTDLMNAHPGWAEFTAYAEAVRQTWVTVAASNAQITNTAAATFTVNATGSIRGIFIVSVNTKTGTTGTLWTSGLFPTALAVVNADQVKITYTVAA